MLGAGVLLGLGLTDEGATVVPLHVRPKAWQPLLQAVSAEAQAPLLQEREFTGVEEPLQTQYQ